MKNLSFFLLLLLLATPCAWCAPAASPAPAASASPIQEDRDTASAAALSQREQTLKSLRYQQGEIVLRNDLAKLNVPAGFRFLGPDDAVTVLTKIWGNPPPNAKPLGLLLPANLSPADEESWAVVITYDDSGYVKDSDAEKIDYNDLLKKMQEETREASKQREAQGYPAIEFVGWAAPPRYDRATNKLYWARDLKFGSSDEHTLNYNIRILGRRGVLVLNAVAALSQLKQIEAATPQLLAMVDFNPGERYADFNPKTDKVAAYGIAALVAGGIAAKAGLFKGLWLLLLAGKKFVIVAVLALLAFIKKLFGGGSKTASSEETSPPAAG